MEMILAGYGARFESTESERAVNRDQKGRRVGFYDSTFFLATTQILTNRRSRLWTNAHIID